MSQRYFALGRSYRSSRPSTRPHWSRKTASSTTEASVEDGPHLDRDTGPGLLEQFPGDGECPVGQQHPSVVVAQSRRRLLSVQAGPAGDVRPVEQGGKATRNRACCPVRVLGRGVGQQRVLHESSSHGSMPVSSIRRTASPWTDSNHRGDFPRRWCPSGAWPFVNAADPPERRRHNRGESMTTEPTPVAYVISAVEGVADVSAVKRYAELAGPAIEHFGGRFIVSNTEPVVVEGESPSNYLSMVEFPSMEDAKAWYNSPEYAEARDLTPAAFRGRLLILVEGD